MPVGQRVKRETKVINGVCYIKTKLGIILVDREDWNQLKEDWFIGVRKIKGAVKGRFDYYYPVIYTSRAQGEIRETVYLARMVWSLHKRLDENQEVVHLNDEQLDCRLCNLRAVPKGYREWMNEPPRRGREKCRKKSKYVFQLR